MKTWLVIRENSMSNATIIIPQCKLVDISGVTIQTWVKGERFFDKLCLLERIIRETFDLRQGYNFSMYEDILKKNMLTNRKCVKIIIEKTLILSKRARFFYN